LFRDRAQPDFGTYHCSTPRASAATREKAKVLFTKAFDGLPFGRNDELSILDVGCGLGFLSCVCAEYYPKASINGFDTFEHASLKDSSLKKARKNAEGLGLSDRIIFQKGDIFSTDFRSKFDIVVSNLVFHNLGRRRFGAYERLARWTTQRSFVVLGDIYFDYKTDARHLSHIYGSVERIPGSAIGSSYKVLVLSQPRGWS
jgi:SAM-dependent methyltransferase